MRTATSVAPRAAARLVVLVASLAGCAVPGTGPVGGAADGIDPADPAAVAALDARRAALRDFAVSGALGYWTDAENVTARLDWREADGRTEIDLVGPLGLGRLALVADGSGASLSRGGAAPVTGASAGALLQRELGLAAPMPLEAARDWLRGLPGEGATDVRRDARGRLETLLWRDASGARWFARVRRWTAADPGPGPAAGADSGAGTTPLELPALVTARSGERRLRLALSDWRLDPASGGDEADGTDGTDGAGRRGVPAGGSAPGGGRLAIPGR